jgi:2-amino-4-hydroxy-6-hydroxymethyldihydropteridine diphosphokinase
MQTAYVGLGSNLQDPVRQVSIAFDDLGALPETRLTARSSLYRTAPVGKLDQPDFVNAVARVETGLGPEALLEALLAIERGHQRVRGERNGPRTLDLDLLLYGSERIDLPGLTVPHPRVHERAFVLVPLAEIAPDLHIPGAGRVDQLAARVGASAVARIAR